MPSTAKLAAVAALTGTVAVATPCLAFVSVPAPTVRHQHQHQHQHQHSTATELQAKGRRSKDLAGIGNASQKASAAKGVKGLGGDALTATAAGKTANWVPVAGLKSMKDLPQEENKVKFVDTQAPTLIDGAVNPTGAVSVVNFKGKTYCFASSCPSCKVPLAKAKVLDPTDETGSDPRVCCDFCSATFNSRTGDRVEDAGGAGFLGGIVKGLMSAQEKVPLQTYDLGEKNGKVLINLPY